MNHQDSFVSSIVHRISSAATLIILGVFLLLNTTGVIPWSAWGTVFLIFIRIWPVFLIFAGLQVLFGKNYIISMIVDVLAGLSFAVVLLIAAYLNISNTKLKTELENSINFPISFTVFNK